MKNKIIPYLISFSLVFLVTLFGEFVKRSLEPTNIVMFYLLIVVFSAIRWGRNLAIITSVLSILVFDFFLIPPYFTLTVDDIQYVFTFIAFLTVGVVVSEFASKLKEQAIQKQTEKLHSALLSSISHDLKTPLVSITGTLTTLLDQKSDLSDAGKKELLQTACGESLRLNRIVNNILDMTKMEAGVLRIFKKPCDLRDLIGACLEQLKDKTPSREIKINIPKGLPEIAVDFPFILKAFFNIIDNAIKYSGPDSPVEISARQLENKITVEIRDYGCGISKEDIGRIFEKFYRAEKAQNVSGTGLGLCIAKSIIEAHSGQITAESTPGKGSIFIIGLPLK